jgi:hypothetical protein
MYLDSAVPPQVMRSGIYTAPFIVGMYLYSPIPPQVMRHLDSAVPPQVMRSGY